MEKKNTKLKNNITQMIGQLSKIYKEISSKENDSYLLGKKEGYEEILNWFLQTHNGDFRYVSANNFFNMIQEKLNKVKIAINKHNEEAEEEILNIKDFRDLKQINFSDLKINDNRKRINRFAQDQSATEQLGQDNNNISNSNNIQFSLINPFLSYPNTNNNQNASLNTNNSILNCGTNSCLNNNANSSNILINNFNQNNTNGEIVHGSNSNVNQMNCFGLSNQLSNRTGSVNMHNPLMNGNNCNGLSNSNSIVNFNSNYTIQQNNSIGNINNIVPINNINHLNNSLSTSNSNNSSHSKKKRK